MTLSCTRRDAVHGVPLPTISDSDRRTTHTCWFDPDRATSTTSRSKRTETAERRGPVDGAIVALLFHGALRRSEVAALCWADVDFSDGDDVVVTVRRSGRTPPWTSRRHGPGETRERSLGALHVLVQEVSRAVTGEALPVPVLDQRRGVLFAASRRGEEASHQPSGLRQQGCEPFAPALAEESDERGGANRTSHGARSRSSWMRAPVS